MSLTLPFNQVFRQKRVKYHHQSNYCLNLETIIIINHFNSFVI